MKDQVEVERFELKYLIDEQRARAVRELVRAYLVDDEFNDPKRGNAYLEKQRCQEPFTSQ